MATERKFAISTSVQSGYEETYSTVNACLVALGTLDLTVSDEKIIIEVFADYSSSVFSVTDRLDFRPITTSRLNDQYIVIQAVSGSEYSYPAATGARLQFDPTYLQLINFISEPDNEYDLLNLGIYHEGAVLNTYKLFYGDGNANVFADRCYFHWPSIFGGAIDIGRLTNSIIYVPGSNSISNFCDAGNNVGTVINSVTGVIGGSATTTYFFRRCVNTDNCFVLNETGGAYTLCFRDCAGDNNAAVDSSAPGANSIDNIIPANEVVDPNSDVHLLETSQLRGAGQNLFGNGYDKDIDGDDRPNAAWDIGADQFAGAAAPEGVNAALFGANF